MSVFINSNKLIIEALTQANKTICTCESLTGGLLGASLVNVSGASNVFKGSLTAYMIEIKENVLKIDKDIINGDAVNAQTARAMAKNCSELMDSDFCLSTTGIAEMYDERLPQAYACIYDKTNDKYFDYWMEFDSSTSRPEVRTSVVDSLLESFLDHLEAT